MFSKFKQFLVFILNFFKKLIASVDELEPLFTKQLSVLEELLNFSNLSKFKNFK